MKVFDKDKKINFVDENNVVLGYDMNQCCCETADWFIADTPQNKIFEGEKVVPCLDGFVFDTGYFQEIKDCPNLYSGEMVAFRITNGKEEKFIHLYNCHNGYYGHGFEFVVNEKTIKEGYL